MHRTLQQAFEQEVEAARSLWAQRQFQAAFSRLENAHVLGQRRFLWHAKVHLWMLRVGWAQKDAREVRGQLWRLFLTPLGHLTGRLPLGNTGGANVSAFAPMPIPTELQAMLGSAPEQAQASKQ